MKKLIAIILVLCAVLPMAACGASEPDPNCGVYEAVSAKAYGIEIDVTDVYDEGFSIELKDGGKCKITIGSQSANGKWTLDGTEFTVSGGGIEESGYLMNGMILLEDVDDSGVDIYFYNFDYEEPEA